MNLASNPQVPLHVTAYTLTSALGAGNDATLTALRARRGGLREIALRAGARSTWLGLVDDDAVGAPLADEFAPYDCRAHRMLGRALARDGFAQAVSEARAQYGPERVGCFVGTIASGLAHLESCYLRYDPLAGDLGPDVRVPHTAHLYSATEYVCRMLDIEGPAATISTACSSSAKVFATAYRHIAAGLCDAAVVAGIDCANEGFIYGFRSLGLLSGAPCRPWDSERDGISIGEAAGFALLERTGRGGGGIALTGFGESSDAYHMTAPHPDGTGARAAIELALRRAGVRANEIDYVNLHGSGTPSNDRSEDAAIAAVFGDACACSSTKGWTGHTQGAAGITEAVLSFLSMRASLIPGTLNTTQPDPELRSPITLENIEQRVRRVLSNSFGFGGNNCALVFEALS
ncbi:beta-ketoacyl-ACP synthase [Trinickia sp. LjRoot230]|uniref:beta-ketoacyl-ACP synthase n=1 Tax=Trinickia sp. LjRoot230 TaxID=3342288 RepID=UPI003ECECD32